MELKTEKEQYFYRDSILFHYGFSKYSDYLKSERWSSLVKEFKKERCQWCDYEENLHLHHNTYQYIFTEREWEDLVTLCDECHDSIHFLARKKEYIDESKTYGFFDWWSIFLNYWGRSNDYKRFEEEAEKDFIKFLRNDNSSINSSINSDHLVDFSDASTE